MKMKEVVNQILESELNKTVDSISEITGLGSVNKVYDVNCKNKSYVVRINLDRNKEFEFWKEKWCIEKVTSLDIPSPDVIKVGLLHDLPFMIMNKVEGSNGSRCSQDDQLSIWKRLGEYANKIHNVKQIDELKVTTDEFHPNWIGKLEYNIGQLTSNDSLLTKNIFRKDEHEICRILLKNLRKKRFNKGLIHGDLCPRNVILQNKTIVLLDWGSSKIDIVPHAEIGIVQTDNKLNPNEFESFLSGYGLSKHEYRKIEDEISQINFLNRLDLYRWAEGSNFIEIDDYASKLKNTFNNIAK